MLLLGGLWLTKYMAPWVKGYSLGLFRWQEKAWTEIWVSKVCERWTRGSAFQLPLLEKEDANHSFADCWKTSVLRLQKPSLAALIGYWSLSKVSWASKNCLGWHGTIVARETAELGGFNIGFWILEAGSFNINAVVDSVSVEEPACWFGDSFLLTFFFLGEGRGRRSRERNRDREREAETDRNIERDSFVLFFEVKSGLI